MAMKICVGLSGGVDSSVAALLLKRQGADVFAMFMRNWDNADVTLHGDCEWEEDRFVAELVARKIGIPFYFVDLSAQYRKRVADYMFEEYAKGRTPNPDVLCNREIKFDAFFEAARKLGADMVATGHYCRKDEVTGPDGQKYQRIFEGVDPNKDQSYFLCQLSQEELSRAVFPIGGLTKPEVRRIAEDADLPSAQKKDSQGICFIGKVDLPTFLKQKIQAREGQVIEVFDAYYSDNPEYGSICRTLSSLTADGSAAKMVTDYISEDKCSSVSSANSYDPEKVAALTDGQLLALSKPVAVNITFEEETYRSGKRHTLKTRIKDNPYGKIAGTHDGAQFYTIGQRKGLGIGGHTDSIFVIGTDIEKNIVYVGQGHRHKGLSRSVLRINSDEIHWMRPQLRLETGGMLRCRVRIRYRQPLQDATLIMRENGLFILFDSPQRGPAPGQFAVWYAPAGADCGDTREDAPEMLGSGPISE